MMPDKPVPFRGAKTDAPITEDAVALAALAEIGNDVRWCPEQRAWRVWKSGGWRLDTSGQAFEMIRGVCRGVTAATGKDKWGAHKTVCSVERFLHTQPGIVAPVLSWDADPWLLGTPGGIVDLRTGEFRAARRAELVSKRTAVDPAREGERPEVWLAFLRQATNGDRDLERYLQRLAGYALTGLVREHALFFVYGTGGNGKGTFLHNVRKVMGDHAVPAAVETFMGSVKNRHPTELALLHGARLVTSSENDQGEAWAEARIKALTGGDPVTARYMRQDFFTFEPTFKIVIIGNHRPVLTNVDAAARRRLRMIPFRFTPPDDDKSLPERLQQEWPAILRWMIDGCLDWAAEEMETPEIVRSETYDYFEEQDLLQQWIGEHCVIAPDQWEYGQKLYESYCRFMEYAGEKKIGRKTFTQVIRKAGFTPKHHTFRDRHTARLVLGLSLQSEGAKPLL